MPQCQSSSQGQFFFFLSRSYPVELVVESACVADRLSRPVPPPEGCGGRVAVGALGTLSPLGVLEKTRTTNTQSEREGTCVERDRISQRAVMESFIHQLQKAVGEIGNSSAASAVFNLLPLGHAQHTHTQALLSPSLQCPLFKLITGPICQCKKRESWALDSARFPQGMDDGL